MHKLHQAHTWVAKALASAPDALARLLDCKRSDSRVPAAEPASPRQACRRLACRRIALSVRRQLQGGAGSCKSFSDTHVLCKQAIDTTYVQSV